MTREEAIKSLEAQRDCIILSCQGACHEGKECDECDFMYAKGTMGTMRQALDVAINALEDSRWIPVTERLPEEYASYYTTIQYKESKARDVAMLCYSPEDKVWLEIWGLGCDVVAWMPLPKEWEGGD